ncbi:MAG: HAD-IA family hydrolase [Gammaproteobacteria bacterium]|nr:HAD-IA family hydrolase [Gammaproteobacteria bacterium]
MKGLCRRFMDHYQQVAVYNSRLYAGAVDTLDKTSAAGYVHGICTNKPHGISQEIIAELGIADRFRSIVGGDSTSARKPEPEPLFACLAELGVDANAAVFAGDSAVDVE